MLIHDRRRSSCENKANGQRKGEGKCIDSDVDSNKFDAFEEDEDCQGEDIFEEIKQEEPDMIHPSFS